MYVWIDLKFHKELKLLIYLKALVEKPFQTFYYPLKNSFEEIEFQNTIIAFIQILYKHTCKGNILQNDLQSIQCQRNVWK
jgi:hypothetical protein